MPSISGWGCNCTSWVLGAGACAWARSAAKRRWPRQKVHVPAACDSKRRPDRRTSIGLAAHQNACGGERDVQRGEAMRVAVGSLVQAAAGHKADFGVRMLMCTGRCARQQDQQRPQGRHGALGPGPVTGGRPAADGGPWNSRQWLGRCIGEVTNLRCMLPLPPAGAPQRAAPALGLQQAPPYISIQRFVMTIRTMHTLALHTHSLHCTGTPPPSDGGRRRHTTSPRLAQLPACCNFHGWWLGPHSASASSAGSRSEPGVVSGGRGNDLARSSDAGCASRLCTQVEETRGVVEWDGRV